MATTIVAGNTYTFKNVYTGKMLNLYAGLTANGTNVCQYTADGSDEQKWTWGSDNKLYTYGSTTKCLDRYNNSSNAMHNNADIWTNNDDTNQKLIVSPISDSSYVTIKISGTNLFLTAYYGTANGANTEARCAPGAAGNVFWATSSDDTVVEAAQQKWIITQVGGSSSGDGSGDSEDNTEKYDYVINGVGLPLEAYPKGSHWTNDGKATDANGSNSIVLDDGSKQCAGFAKYVYKILWGSYTAGHAVPSEITLSGEKSDFDSIGRGARINCRGTGAENHSMILLDKDDYGVTIYDANWDKECGVDVRTYSYSDFATTMWRIKTTSYTP